MTETEPNRSQRNETAVRWFLMFLLDPVDRRAVLEREIASIDRTSGGCWSAATRCPSPSPSGPPSTSGCASTP